MGPILVIVVVLVVLLVVCVAIYNGLVSLRQQTMNAWAQIDVQLKRRYDLIPNLVETVKGYMAHEKDTLEKVIAARNSAIGAEGVKDKAAAENQLSRALTGFFAVAEAYPELRASEAMGQLQEELRATENKISFARQYYNDVVTAYNTKIEAFPSSIFASAGGFKPRDLFELDDAAAREPVKVQF
jgi:LemA protein